MNPVRILALAGLMATATSSASEPGATLAGRFCTPCHRLPDPSELDKAGWRDGALPLMRRRLGIDRLRPEEPDQKAVLDDFEAIARHYVESAPETPNEPPLPPIRIGLAGFTVIRATCHPTNQMTSLVHIDPVSHRLLVGNQETRTLDVVAPDGTLLSSLPVESPPVHAARVGEDLYVTLIWSLSPHEARRGKVLRMRLADDHLTQVTEVLSGLPRPVHTSVSDLKDGRGPTLFVSGFGFLTGALSRWDRDSSGNWNPRVLHDQAGVLKTDVRDWTGDGKPDVLAWVAQGREGLLLYRNDGAGGFGPEERLLEFGPSWGSAGFAVADMDGDGLEDLVAANGDTGEYAGSNRPYHGIRILLRKPGPRFVEWRRLPQHGAYGARVLDADGDGDLDIAANSFFPDYRGRMEESFVLWRNQGGGRFEPEAFEEIPSGRWMTLDAGDLDGDGDDDLVLGAANWVAFPVLRDLAAHWRREPVSVVILRNDRKPTSSKP